jgi:hypothetical protein
MIKDLTTTIYKYKTFIAVSTVIIVLLSVSIIPRSLYTPQTTAASSFGTGQSNPNSLNSVIGKFGSSSSQSGFGSNTLNSQPSSSDTIKQFTGLSKASDPNGVSNTGSGSVKQSQADPQSNPFSSFNSGNANGGNANGGNANGGNAHGNNGNAHSTGSGSATGGNSNGNSANGGTGGAGGAGGAGGNKYSNSGSLPGGSSFS